MRHAPYIPRGGILADDMGLGKTIQVISLMAAAREAEDARLAAGEFIDDVSDMSTGVQDDAMLAQMIKTRATLIVCPLSVIGNWVSQMDVR